MTNVASPLRVLTIATLFPQPHRPNFGIFVERSMAALSRQPGVALTIVAPVGVPPWPIDRHQRYAPLRAMPSREFWHGLDVRRPRFSLLPGLGAARNGAAVAKAVLQAIADDPPFDVISAEFFHPDAVAAQAIGKALALPYSVKARGNDIMHWAQRKDTGPGIVSAAKGAAGILSVADALREEMVRLGFPADRIALHRTGIDPVRFRPLDHAAARAHFSLPEGAPVVLSVGTLDENKGHHLVIDALRQLPDAIHMIAGIGPDQAALKQRADAAGLSHRVQLLGSVAHDDLPLLYNAADVMALPSAREGLANAWVEALACGTPIIAADIPNAKEAIAAPADGRIVARHADAIAAALSSLFSERAQHDRAALSTRTHARFDWDRHGVELAAHLARCARG